MKRTLSCSLLSVCVLTMTVAGTAAGNLTVVAAYPSDGPDVASGMLVGDEHLAGRAPVVEVELGAGRIVMYGFRVQHRGQTHGTYKLVFNALYRGE